MTTHGHVSVLQFEGLSVARTITPTGSEGRCINSFTIYRHGRPLNGFTDQDMVHQILAKQDGETTFESWPVSYIIGLAFPELAE